MIVLYDPGWRLTVEQVRAWFVKTHHHAPQVLYMPALNWPWWHIGYGPGNPPNAQTDPNNPYSDPPIDEHHPLFQQIAGGHTFQVFMPVITKGD